MTTILIRKITGALLLPALLASCASLSPESRLRTKLVEAGISPRTATCMAQRMADRLNIGQLRQLQSMASLRKSHSGAMSVDEILYKLRALDDPEIFSVTTNAALRCAIRV